MGKARKTPPGNAALTWGVQAVHALRAQIIPALLGAGHEWSQSLRVRLVPPILDLVFLGYLWTATSITYSYFRFGVIRYSLLSWEWAALVVVAAAALWSALDQTVGLKVVRHRLPSASPGARFFYALFWLLFPLTPLTALFDRRHRSPAEILTELSLAEEVLGERRPWYKTVTGWVALYAILITLGAAVGVTRVDPRAFVTRFEKTVKFWRAIFAPAWNLAGLGLQLLAETLFMAIVSTALAVPVAAALSFLAARNLMQGPVARPIYTVLRFLGSFTRSVDAIIWAIVFVVWVGTGSFAGVLALFIHSVVDLMKLYAEQVEAIDPGPVEAITATGANRLQVIRYGIIPQIVNPFISFTLYRWDINVRMATVVGLVGGGGIGFRLAWYLGSYAFSEATMLTILIIVMVWAIDWLSARLREKLA